MSTNDPAASPSDLRALAEQSNAWPFEQAKAIVARLKNNPKDEVLFETGYGPSGLPHIGTYGEVMAIILPTLGPDRRATYSPFLPISQTTGVVLQVPMIRRDTSAGTITYVDPDTGGEVETAVTGGNVKCQWKADWAMRWVAL